MNALSVSVAFTNIPRPFVKLPDFLTRYVKKNLINCAKNISLSPKSVAKVCVVVLEGTL